MAMQQIIRCLIATMVMCIICLLSIGCVQEPVTVVLKYKVDSEGIPVPQQIGMQDIVTAWIIDLAHTGRQRR